MQTMVAHREEESILGSDHLPLSLSLRIAPCRPCMVQAPVDHLHKLYAVCRLKGELESLCGARQLELFPRQAGFLRERSSLQNMFVLQHLAHHHKRLRSPIHVSLLDVKGAQ
jgi:hypothetical protein